MACFTNFQKGKNNTVFKSFSALSTGQTEIFNISETGSSSLRFIPKSATLVLTAITGTLVTPAVISIGTVSPYTNIMQALTLTELSTAYNAMSFVLPATLASLDLASNSIYANVSVAAAGIGLTTYTGKIILEGFFE